MVIKSKGSHPTYLTGALGYASHAISVLYPARLRSTKRRKMNKQENENNLFKIPTATLKLFYA